MCADGDTETLSSKISRSLKKVAIKTRDESRLVLLFIVLVTALQQFLEYKSSRLNGYGSPASNYYLRASRDLNDLTWADILFLSTLSLPTVKIVCRVCSSFEVYSIIQSLIKIFCRFLAFFSVFNSALS